MEIQTEFPGAEKMQNPSNCSELDGTSLNENQRSNSNSKPKVIVIMGATGAGKSKLAIDLASHFPVEVINADSMQVYQGLDVLTNKVRSEEQRGVVHHLLGTISSNVEFTAKDFHDHAIPLIDEISSRNFLPVIVGGTNYYIQALVSPFLMDVGTEDTEEVNCSLDPPENEQPSPELEIEREGFDYTYDCLKAIDPVAANRLHPNDHRKVHQYLNLYARFGIPPSKVLQEKTAENWGHVDNSRFDFCVICVDASLSALDPFVDKRVDDMIEAGLLDEVFDIYRSDADYTKGLRQAIGVREFNDFLTYYQKHNKSSDASLDQTWSLETFRQTVHDILYGDCDDERKVLLTAAIDKMKLNTRRLVRRQRRRLQRLQMLFGWEIHYIDVTSSISGASDETWAAEVVQPAMTIIKSFLNRESCLENTSNNTDDIKLKQRDLWSQYICEACGNKVLRGGHEWEQHRQGRSHRKRISRLKKCERISLQSKNDQTSTL